MERIEKERRQKEQERLEREKKEREQKEKERKEKERKRLEKEKKEKEQKEKEQKEELERKRIEIEKKRKELEENKKKQKEKEKKEQQKLNYSIKKNAEEELIMEEMKNNEFDKQNKDKEKDFYKIYLNSLQKRPNSFKQDLFKKDYDFTPLVYKHPEKIYLKAVSDYQNDKEKMKKYNKKTGLFDLYLNRTRTNKFYIDAEKKENNNNIDNTQNKLKVSNSSISKNNNNNNTIDNQFKKKNIRINISRGNSTGFQNKNTTSKSTFNTFLTNSSKQKKINLLSKKSNSKSKEKKLISNSSKKYNNEEKGEITLDEMINFLLDKENEKLNQRKINLANPINYRKASEQKKKIINSLNDPGNPYSALFYNNMLYNNYKVGMHYNEMEQGVPYLRIKKMKKTSLPPLTQGNLFEEKMLCNTYSSGFNFNNKKQRMIILPSNVNQFNKSSSRKKVNNSEHNKNEKKDKIEGNVLFQSYGEKTDFYNDEFELPKVDKENKNKRNASSREQKKLSGIIEEDN